MPAIGLKLRCALTLQSHQRTVEIGVVKQADRHRNIDDCPPPASHCVRPGFQHCRHMSRLPRQCIHSGRNRGLVTDAKQPVSASHPVPDPICGNVSAPREPMETTEILDPVIDQRPRAFSTRLALGIEVRQPVEAMDPVGKMSARHVYGPGRLPCCAFKPVLTDPPDVAHQHIPAHRIGRQDWIEVKPEALRRLARYAYAMNRRYDRVFARNTAKPAP